MGAVRLASTDRGPGVPADRVVGGAPDGPDPLDGIGDRAAVYRRGARSPRARSSRPACTSARGCWYEGRDAVDGRRGDDIAASVRVRLFAMQREVAGSRELRLEVPAPRHRRRRLGRGRGQAVPALAPGRAALRFAVNGTYADPDTLLADGDEVACIPPVSGGPADHRSARQAASGRRNVPSEVAADGRTACSRSGPTRCPMISRRAGDAPRHGRGRRRGAFVGRTRVTPGTPAPGQEAEAARHAGRMVEGLEYEAFEPMAARGPRARSPTRSSSGSACAGWPSSIARAPCPWARHRWWWSRWRAS